MTPPLVSIVFLNYNRLNETRITLHHLLDLTENRPDVEMIAVDNGSQDGTRAFLESYRSKVTVIVLSENEGIGGLNNGFEAARGKYIMVLDDDSMPVDASTIDKAVAHLEAHPEAGLVACRILTRDGRPFSSWHLPAGLESKPAACFVGCGFVIRRALFKKIGWFPAHFFLYQNEVAVAIRLFQQGFDIHYLPESLVIHRESPAGRTGWRKVFFPTRNTIWLIRRYIPQPEASYLILSRLLFGLFRAIESGCIRWYVRAIVEAMGRPAEKNRLSATLLKKIEPFRRHNRLDLHLRKWMGCDPRFSNGHFRLDGDL